MKRIIAILLLAAFLITSVSAAGDPNIDGGGGSTGGGTSDNKWSIGNDGIRVTIIREDNRQSLTTPIDFTNVTSPNINFYFGAKNKLHYKGNPSLTTLLGSSYQWINPVSSIPPIVTSDGRTNIAAVKEYFGREGTIQDIADKTGFNYDELISGEYVILLEPLVYITYNGIKMAMTATEAALYDQIVSGDLKSKLGFITHQNLPLAMFLETSDLGYPAWSGATSGIRANADIISSLGLGTVRFSELPPSGGGGTLTADYEYHTNTDVITSVWVRNNSDEGISPDSPASVTFNINGTSYRKHDIIIPPNESQLVWVKWKTPSTPQVINIGVSVSGGAAPAKSVIVASITNLKEQTPPNTQGRDRNDSFHLKSMPNQTDATRHEWGIWWARWEPKWEWESDWDWVEEGCDSSCPPNCGSSHGSWEDNGKYVDKGFWVYEYDSYFASLSILNTQLTPDERVPTAKKRAANKWEIKSGYGVNINIKTNVSTNAGSTAVTPIQNIIARFPEFDYTQYNRLLVRDKDLAGMMHEWRFADNPYSQFHNPVHFTPIWYPDNLKYEVYAWAFDAWTRATRS